MNYCDHFLKRLREHSIIPGQEKYIGSIGNDRCGMVDLENGTCEPVKKFKNFVADRDEIYPFAQRLVVHNGLLWTAVSSSGKNYIVAIDRHTGEYTWTRLIDVYGLVLAPVFFHNYMMLQTDAGELVVMKKTDN